MCWFSSTPWPTKPPVPPPSIDPNFTCGVVYAPFTQEEWEHLIWVPVYRIHLDQAEMMVERGASFLLIIDLLDNQSLSTAMPLILDNSCAGVELGNEPSFNSPSPTEINSWYQSAYAFLRSHGFQGPIITAGVANIDSDTLKKAYKSLQGLPEDIFFGWHAYSSWQNQLGNLRQMLQGRRHWMTEWGIPAKEGTEEEIATRVSSDLALIKQSGAGLAFYYQLHDGPPNTVDNDFGLHALPPPYTQGGGHWRKIENVLHK